MALLTPVSNVIMAMKNLIKVIQVLFQTMILVIVQQIAFSHFVGMVPDNIHKINSSFVMMVIKTKTMIAIMIVQNHDVAIALWEQTEIKSVMMAIMTIMIIVLVVVSILAVETEF